MAFSIITLQSGITKIALEGDLDTSTIYGLRSELSVVVQRGPTHVDMELSRLRWLDPHGTQVLVAFFTNLTRLGCRLTFRGLHEQPLESLKAALASVIREASQFVN